MSVCVDRANPNPNSERLGWRLMLVCASCFAPGEELACYLRSYMYKVYAKHQAQDDAVGNLARASLGALQKTLKNGRRSMLPFPAEINAIQNMTPSTIQVHLLHG